MGASNENLDEVRAVDPSNVCGVKVFMGSSTGNMLVDKAEILESIFKAAPLLIATHCEDTPMILENEAKAKAQFGKRFPIISMALFDREKLATNLLH